MQKHVKNYFKHFGYGETDFIKCEVCPKRAVDIHHIVFRSHGGTDEINNLIALCREHHDKAHDEREFNNQLKQHAADRHA